jgi:hypothetical protein
MILSVDLLAQDGRWVAYSLDGIGSGPIYHDCGDGVIGYAPANSQYLLIFDIRTGEWKLVNLGSTQTFDYLETQGNVLLARSEDLLFGYSSSLGVWDTIHYEGTVYMDLSSQLFQSYGCSDSLAFYVTDHKFYVFDGSLGYWQQYDYGYQEDFSGGYFHPKDDCIILMLLKPDFYAGIMNVAYSSHTRSFNKLENGCVISKSTYDHGYAGIHDKTGDGKEFLLVGYSAFDNQFDVIHYSTGENESGMYFYDAGTIEADTFTAFTCGFRTVVVPYEHVRAKIYGYSTILGSWNTITYDFDHRVERYYGSGYVGGQFTIDNDVINESGYYHFFFYSAVNGLFHDINTDLVYTSTTSAFSVGGSVFCVFDAQHGWGYNPVKQLGSNIDLVYDQFTHIFTADDYATFCRWSQTSETMRMYFYNSNTNNWSWIDTPEHWDQAGTGTAHIYMHKAWPENNAIVYSSFQDTILQRDFPDSIYVSTGINGTLACARSENRSFLFNCEACTVHEKNFEFNQNGLGSRSAAFYDTTGGRILHGYSSLSDRWTTHSISDQPYYCYDPGYIGLISAWVGMNGYGKFYAFNSLADSWVELIPEGKHVSFRVGNRTALVIRLNHVYAFDPYTSTDVIEETDKLNPSGFILLQNYPNPFNAATTISYELAEPSAVVLTIYNNLGQEVRMLVNEYQAAGEWSVTWDGTNSDNQPASSGIYFYELKAGGETESRRMILLNDGDY